MPATFKTVGIIGRITNPAVVETIISLIDYLQDLNQAFLVDAETAQVIDDKSLPVIPRAAITERCDLLIVVGGDGSLLHAAHIVVDKHIPVLGINRGRLGFLTDVRPTEFDKIKAILQGHYIAEDRFLLTASVVHEGKVLGQCDALNEVALIPDSVPHMNEFEIYINDHFVCSQDSDGVIVATPTGSTAYALSGGGPILQPELDAIVIVPMFPHTLSIRPIVIEGNSRIKVIISSQNSATPRVACDGHAFISTPPGSEITIEKKATRLRLIHPADYDYYATLRTKLHWGHKLQHSE